MSLPECSRHQERHGVYGVMAYYLHQSGHWSLTMQTGSPIGALCDDCWSELMVWTNTKVDEPLDVS